MATLKDVACRAGVSIATVSYVLNNTKAMSKNVAERVKRAAKELEYHPNRSARVLRTGIGSLLGLIVPDLQNPFFPALVQTIGHKARSLGYDLSLIDAANNPRIQDEALWRFAEQGVDAAICIPLDEHRPSEPPFPLIVVDRPLGTFVPVDSIYADHFGGGQLLAKYVQALGHTRVGLLSGPQELPSGRLRREGLLSGLKDKVAIVWEVEVPFSLKLPSAAVRKLLSREASMVVGGSDVIAIGAIQTLSEHKISVPNEVSVLGFDDIPWASIVSPRLTTVRQPVIRLGERAVEVALHRLKMPDAPSFREVLPVSLIKRESARALHVL